MTKSNTARKDDDAANSATVTTSKEQKQVDERVAINAKVVYVTIRREGEEELKRPSAGLAWSALAAGLSMGFSLMAEALLTAHLPATAWRPLVSKAGYSVGFLIVILGRQQLFTENTLTVILPALLNRNRKTVLQVLRVWSIILTANLLGTFLFALCIARLPVFDAPVHQTFMEIGLAHLGTGFFISFIRAIFAGWLIALMVWLLPGADTSRIPIIIIVTYLVGLGNLNHIIAGSTTLFYLCATGSLSFGGYFLHFFIPTLLGNIIGGVSLVAALGHAQVVGGRD
jgi:formate/nitrite transporter FocA (FNT family)